MSTALLLGSERGDVEASPVPLEPETGVGGRAESARHGPRPLPGLDLDDSLMLRVREADETAFEELVERWQSRVLGYLTGMLSDRDEALDATQETFVRLFTRANLHQPRGSFKAWLYRIATNVALDHLRQRKRRRWVGLGDALLRRHPSAPGTATDGDGDGISALAARPADGSALAGLLEQERAEALHRAIGTLPPAYRSAIVLKDLQDLGYEEAAAALGVSVGTVKSRVSRGRDILREKLSTLLGPPAGAAAAAGRRTDA